MSTKLVRVRCQKCGQRLADVLPGASVLCVTCGVWTQAIEPQEDQVTLTASGKPSGKSVSDECRLF